MKKLERMTKQGAQTGLECLLAICRDEEQKAAYRMSAAKALIDYGRKAEDVYKRQLQGNGSGHPDPDLCMDALRRDKRAWQR